MVFWGGNFNNDWYYQNTFKGICFTKKSIKRRFTQLDIQHKTNNRGVNMMVSLEKNGTQSLKLVQFAWIIFNVQHLKYRLCKVRNIG